MRLATLTASFLVALVAAATLAGVTSAHLDHPLPTTGATAPPLSTEFNSGGERAEWELLATIPTLNPHSDLDFFQRQGETYASVGSLGAAVNGGGQVIFQLTEKGEVTSTSPRLVSNHPSASCVSDPSAALGLQHDVEVTPKARTIQNTQIPGQNTGDGQLIIDATDAAGRCHDQGLGGLSGAPDGGLELIDITDIDNPKEIGLTSHIGEAHTTNVDPRRPHIVYVVTSDSVGVDAAGVRANETGTGRALDGFEIADIRSCLETPLGTVPAGATIERKRELCRPAVYRYRYPSTDIVRGHTNRGTVYGCHELEVYPDDRLTCGSGTAAIVFDIKKVFDDAGTPDDFTDDRVRGTPLPCAIRDSSTQAGVFATGAKVTDCVTGAGGVDLGVGGWIAAGSPSLTGVEHVGSAFHMGRESATGALQPAFPATEDIDFDHEVEFTDSRRFLLATDERGGGVTGGAQCTQGTDLDFANGGIHAYAVDRLQKSTPTGDDAAARAKVAHEAYAKTSTGERAIFRAMPQTPIAPSFCTAHVFQQIPGENRIFMGWYSQGTQVVDFTENPDGTIDFSRSAYFIPENANQWVSAIFKVVRNGDGTTTYFGATGDGVVGNAGRNGIDIYRVTLPDAPKPLPRIGGAAPATTPGVPSTPAAGSCTVPTGFSRASVARAGSGLRFDFTRRVPGLATVEVFQDSIGSRLLANRRVARFTGRAKTFTWNARGLQDGTFLVRMRVAVPGRGTDVRRFAVRRSGGRLRVVRAPAQRDGCGLLRAAKLRGTAFGGPGATPLGISFKVGQSARVSITVRRGNRVVRRLTPKTYDAGRTVRLRVSSRKLARGEYTVEIEAKRGSRRATATLGARRI